MEINRRRFLKRTLVTATACGFARVSPADNAASAERIIDTHVYIGHWPSQRLLDEDLANLATLLDSKNVSQAWIGSFDGLFHKDIAAVNQRLADVAKSVAPKIRPMNLHPFGTINPTLPDWEDDVRHCHETFEMPGVRLHPNYHGYTLDDSRFSRLLEMCAADGLIVQLVCWMDDSRRQLLSPTAVRVDLKPLPDKVAPLKELRLVISNGYRTADDTTIRALLPMKQVYFDFAQATSGSVIRELVDRTSADRVVFGSCAPLHEIAAPLTTMQKAQLTHAERSAIELKNANELISSHRHG